MNTSNQKLTSGHQPGMAVATDVKAGVDSCQGAIPMRRLTKSPEYLAMRNAKMLERAAFMKSLNPETPTETGTETPIA